MELQIQKQSLPVSEAVFDSQCEQAVESDLLLPDYCPDIQRILSCDVSCLIRETKAQQQRISLEGELRLNVLYVSDGGQLRAVEQKIPFSRQLDSKQSVQDALVDVQSRVDYLNCRAVSSRRMEIRGAITLSVRAIRCSKAEVLADAKGMGIQLKKRSFDMNSCVSGGESSFTVREELELGSHPPIGQILSSRVQAVVKDHKLLSGKIVSKGEVQLHLLYLPLSADENEEPKQLDYTIPISQILSGGVAEEDCGCCVSYFVSGWDIQPKADMDGEMKVLSVEVQLRAVAAVHCEKTVTLVEDVYSTLCAVEAEESKLTYLNFVRCVQEEHRLRESLGGVKEPKKLLDCRMNVRDVQSRADGDGILLTAAVTLWALLQDSEGNYQIAEENLNAEHRIPLEAGQKGLLFGLQLLPLSVEGSLNGGSVEIRAILQLSASLYEAEQRKAVSGIRVDENCQKENAGDCALCIYYADPQESVWDIGKKYNSSVAGIMEENGLEHDILPQRTMLLIPMC